MLLVMMTFTGGKKMILIFGIIFFLKLSAILSWSWPVERDGWLIALFVKVQNILD